MVCEHFYTKRCNKLHIDGFNTDYSALLMQLLGAVKCELSLLNSKYRDSVVL